MMREKRKSSARSSREGTERHGQRLITSVGNQLRIPARNSRHFCCEARWLAKRIPFIALPSGLSGVVVVISESEINWRPFLASGGKQLGLCLGDKEDFYVVNDARMCAIFFVVTFRERRFGDERSSGKCPLVPKVEPPSSGILPASPSRIKSPVSDPWSNLFVRNVGSCVLSLPERLSQVSPFSPDWLTRFIKT